MLQTILTNLPYFLLLLLGFGFIIFVHELGHFLVAKAVGVKCTQFAVGMGHAIVAWRKGLGLRIGSTEREYGQRIADYLNGQLAQKPELRNTLRIAGSAEPYLIQSVDELSRIDRDLLNQAVGELGLGETEYRLCWLPIGGYVKMLGQDDLDATAGSAAAADPRSLTAKPVWARAAVFSAGVVMNIIFGLIFFAIAFSLGVKFNAPVVGPVAPGSNAATTFAQGHEDDPDYQGLQPGDRIVTLNGQMIRDIQELRINVALSEPQQSLMLQVDRDGQELTFRIVPESIPTYMQGLLTIGFDNPVTLQLDETLPAEALPLALAEAGVVGGMRVVAVDGKPVTHYGQFRQAVMQGRGRPVSVEFVNADGTTTTAALAADPMPQVADYDGQTLLHVLGLVPAVRVGLVADGSPAAAAGVQHGDVIAHLGSASYPSWTQIVEQVKQAGRGPLAVTVLRNGERVDLPAIAPRGGKIGIGMALELPAIVRTVLPDSPAAELRLPPGSRIVGVDGRSVASLDDLQRHVARKAQSRDGDGELTVAIEIALPLPDEPTESTVLTIDADTAAALADAWRLPLTSDLFQLEFVTLKADNPWQAIGLGMEKTHQTMLQVYVTLARLFQGSVGVEHLQGPVGIVHTGTRVARQGGTYLLFFLGLISVNLAVINFLPIPIVDGGHMVFLLVEKLKGSPVSDRIQTAALYVGLALILSIFAMTFYYDIARIVTGG